MTRRTSRAKAAARAAMAPPAATRPATNAIADPRLWSREAAEEERTPRPINGGPRTVPGKGEAAARQAMSGSFSRARAQPAVQRPGRAAQTPGRLVQGQTLEVTEHHGRAENSRQVLNRAVDRLGFFAVDRRLVGWRTYRVGRHTQAARCPSPLIASPSSRRRRQAPICCFEHTAQHVEAQHRTDQLPSRSGSRIERALLGQHEEHRLERVLGMMLINQELAADSQHHRPVPSYQRREGSLTGRATAVGRIPLQKLAVGQPRDRAHLEERLELSHHGSRRRARHRGLLSRDCDCWEPGKTSVNYCGVGRETCGHTRPGSETRARARGPALRAGQRQIAQRRRVQSGPDRS